MGVIRLCCKGHHVGRTFREFVMGGSRGMSWYVGLDYYVCCGCVCCFVVVSRRPESCIRSRAIVYRRQWSLCSSSVVVVGCRVCHVS